MVKIQFGAGDNILEGWTNLQQNECDITKPLSFDSNSVDYILIEHVVEHVTQKAAYSFFHEAKRILKPGGVIRIIVPDAKKMFEQCNDKYLDFINYDMRKWWSAADYSFRFPLNYKPTRKDAMDTIIFCHGHQAIWTQELLIFLLNVVGLNATAEEYLKSKHKELENVDGHWKMMGLENCIYESCVVEGEKIL